MEGSHWCLTLVPDLSPSCTDSKKVSLPSHGRWSFFSPAAHPPAQPSRCVLRPRLSHAHTRGMSHVYRVTANAHARNMLDDAPSCHHAAEHHCKHEKVLQITTCTRTQAGTRLPAFRGPLARDAASHTAAHTATAGCHLMPTRPAPKLSAEASRCSCTQRGTFAQRHATRSTPHA